MSGVSDELKYLWWALILLFIVGSFTFIVSSFQDSSGVNQDQWTSPIANFIQNGHNFNITIPIPILPNLNLNFNFNPFALLGSNVQNFLVSQFQAFGVVPVWIAVPLLILIASGILYFIIKLIQGFIP